VFGPGGVGKSEMGRFFSASHPGRFRPREYIPSDEIEKGKLHDFWGGFLILPGQEDVFEEDWDKILAHLLSGKSRIAINIVAWGYHSIASPYGYEETKWYQKGASINDFLNVYLPACRKREEEQLKYLEPYLISAKKNIRMLTLITKQDLWWPDRKAVQDHYEKGDYGSTIENIKKTRDQRNKRFVHDYLPVSLVRSNFRDGKGVVLVETARGYDDSLQQSYQARLMKTVRNYASR
jgi:hypothetical protein